MLGSFVLRATRVGHGSGWVGLADRAETYNCTKYLEKEQDKGQSEGIY